MPDAASWSARNRELIFACRVIEARFGEKAVDAIAAQHMENVRTAFRRRAAEAGRNDLSVLAEQFDRIGDTHECEIVRRDAHRLEIKVTRCAHADQFARWNACDLGVKFMCAGDLAMIEGLNPKIRLERPELLMNGDPCCRFIYTLDE